MRMKTVNNALTKLQKLYDIEIHTEYDAGSDDGMYFYVVNGEDTGIPGDDPQQLFRDLYYKYKRVPKPTFAGVTQDDIYTIGLFMSYMLQHEYREFGWTEEQVMSDLMDRWIDEGPIDIDKLKAIIKVAIDNAKDDAETTDRYGNGEYGDISMSIRGITREYTLSLRFYDVTVSTTKADIMVLEHESRQNMPIGRNEVARFLAPNISKHELLLVEAFLEDHKY